MPHAAQRLARARALESMVRDIARDEILPRYLKSARNRKPDARCSPRPISPRNGASPKPCPASSPARCSARK